MPMTWREELAAMLRPSAGGAHLVSVAPPLRQIARGANKTTLLAARYFRDTITSTLGIEL